MRVSPHKYGESILLAVSGGVDSMVMAELFFREHTKGNLPLKRLAVANCNFHLRGEESDGDSELVKSWCASAGVEFFSRDFDTRKYMSTNGISLEMAARELRYKWFDDLCAEHGFDGVCVAHNANDNAETLMLNLLRGTGMKGLCAMSEVSGNPYGGSKVFRPLLHFTRAQIEAWAQKHGLTWRTDSSNLQSDCKRNVLRNELFPLLRQINPSFVETFCDDILHFRQASSLVDTYVSRALASLGVDLRAGRIELSWDRLREDPHAEYLLYEILENFDFNKDAVEAVCRLYSSDTVQSGLRFSSASSDAVTTSRGLVIERRGSDAEGKLCVEELRWERGMDFRTQRGCILVDADALGHYPTFRKWEDGDYLCPIGLKGRKKVSDMLTDLKYNVLEKDRALVLEGQGSHVLALVGERIDNAVRITNRTTRVYRISFLRR